MKKFMKNPAAGDVVFLPGVGRLQEGQVLVGNEYAKFAPSLLVEVPDAPAKPPVESTQPRKAPSLLTEPVDSPAVPLPESGPGILEEEVPVDPAPSKKSRKKKDAPPTE